MTPGSEPFLRELLASLKQRGLTGERLVVSDVRVGFTKAVGRMFRGCSLQRCGRVHFARNLRQAVPSRKAYAKQWAQQVMAAGARLWVFSQQSTAAVKE